MLQSLRGLFKNTFHKLMHCTAAHGTVLASNRQKYGRGLALKRDVRQPHFAAVACQFHHQLIGGRDNPKLVSFAKDFQPPALLAIPVATAEKTAHLIVYY